MSVLFLQMCLKLSGVTKSFVSFCVEIEGFLGKTVQVQILTELVKISTFFYGINAFTCITLSEYSYSYIVMYSFIPPYHADLTYIMVTLKTTHFGLMYFSS
jgi:hypothetical protein